MSAETTWTWPTLIVDGHYHGRTSWWVLRLRRHLMRWASVVWLWSSPLQTARRWVGNVEESRRFRSPRNWLLGVSKMKRFLNDRVHMSSFASLIQPRGVYRSSFGDWSRAYFLPKVCRHNPHSIVGRPYSSFVCTDRREVGGGGPMPPEHQ